MGIIRNAKLLWYLSPYMDKLGEYLTMTKSVHGTVQALLTLAQMLNGLTAFTPDKYKIWVAVSVSAVQGIIAVLNHFDSTVTPPTVNVNTGTGSISTDTTKEN
jgi:hypothetical protein